MDKRKNLIHLRQEKNYTQKQLAKAINISEKHYQSLEAGTSDGSVKVWQRLKELLGATSIDFLLEQEAEKNNQTNTSYHK